MNDGGHAFPNHHIPPTKDFPGWLGSSGMSLRDWFAGMALSSILSINQTLMEGLIKASNKCGIKDFSETAALECYELADAMLKERGKNNE